MRFLLWVCTEDDSDRWAVAVGIWTAGILVGNSIGIAMTVFMAVFYEQLVVPSYLGLVVVLLPVGFLAGVAGTVGVVKELRKPARRNRTTYVPTGLGRL